MRKAEFLSELHMQDTLYPRYIELLDPLGFYSEILGMELWVPECFVCDKESTPIIEGLSMRGGIFHDYLSRKDSTPIVSKSVAASVYMEVMIVRDAQIAEFMEWSKRHRAAQAIRRNVKVSVVRVWPGYFHKHLVNATLKQLLDK